MQARHSVISLAALTRCIRRSSVVNNMSARFLVVSFQVVAKILVLVRRLWAGLVFDEPAFLTQPLGLHRLRVALIIFGGSQTKRKGARRRAGADAQLSRAGRGGDPAVPASAMTVANGEHRSR